MDRNERLFMIHELKDPANIAHLFCDSFNYEKNRVMNDSRIMNSNLKSRMEHKVFRNTWITKFVLYWNLILPSIFPILI